MAHSLVSANFTFTEANTSGGVLFERNINPDANFHLGGVAMGKIEFTILDYDDSILQDRIVYPIVFNDGVTYWTLEDGTKVGLYQRSLSKDILGEEFLYTQDGVQMGYFTVDSIERVDSLKVKVTAYDRMKLFESSADEWLAELDYNGLYTVTNSGNPGLVERMCDHLGITLGGTGSAITNMRVRKGFTASSVTYRQVLNWVCEARGQFAYIGRNGNLYLSYYATVNKTYDASATMGTTVAEFNVSPFASVQLQSTDNDIGVTVGSGDPKYVITANPIIFGLSDSGKNTVATKMLARVGGVSYTPASFTIWDENNVRPFTIGNIVTLKTAHNPTDGYTVYIMSERHINQQHTAECFGTQDNIQRRSASTQIKQLAGKTAELKVELDELSSTYTDTAEGLQSQITQNASDITTKVSKNGVISAINQSAETISISANKVNLSGYVTVNGLKTAGSTTINGGNITTGKINADLITTGTLSADRIKGGHIKADIIDGGTLNASSLTINGLTIDASAITSGTLSDNRIGDLSAGKLTSGTLSTARLDAGETSNYLSNSGTLLKKNGTFSGMVQWGGGGGMYKDANTSRVTIAGGSYPIVFTGNSMILSLGGGGITVWGRPTFNYGIEGPLTVNGSFSVTGSKNALVDTEHYGKRLINAYETAEVYFGDIGEGEVKGGRCDIVIDPIFAETVNTELPYQVFLTPYGRGQIWVSERLPDKFIVEGDDIKFGYEIKAKRRGFEEVRLKEYIEKTDEELKESEKNA